MCQLRSQFTLNFHILTILWRILSRKFQPLKMAVFVQYSGRNYMFFLCIMR